MLEKIKSKITSQQYLFSKHAVDQSFIRQITVSEIEEAIFINSEIIEDYPQDKYSHSCLVLGFTVQNRALHIVCGDIDALYMKIITVYEPDKTKWIDHKIRKVQ